MSKNWEFDGNDRHILVITGDYKACQKLAKSLTKNLDVINLENPKAANQFLGQECDAVIFHAHQTFDPNAFGAISGTIRNGGYLLLLTPPHFSQENLFLQRFEQLLKQSTNTIFINADADTKTQIALKKPDNQRDQNNLYATKDQQKAVQAIMHVVTGHRRRPLVITADRGRGKSAALGIAAAQIYQSGKKKIIVCAPSKKKAAMIFKHAKFINPDIKLNFYSPDELYQNLPDADLVMIDEAAAIPLPMLKLFLQHYSRIVFSSTQHGYEGSGRGFAINFKKSLQKYAPEWKSCKLKLPIRWNSDDSLEAFTFDALLLDAEPCNKDKLVDINIPNCTFETLNKEKLVNDPKRLREVFGLLVNAHYQTKPSDLKQMLNDDKLSIVCLIYKNSVIAVALICTEGNIDKETAEGIFNGTRRIQGHLVAQSLSANLGIIEAPLLRGDRILRIAVHPAIQQRGYGTFLLEQIDKHSQADYLSSSFGATPEVLDFWKKAGYQSVYLGIKRDASSGTHSAIVLKAINEKGEAILEKAENTFRRNFPHLLSDPLKNLEPHIAFKLLKSPKEMYEFSTDEIKQLKAFAHASRGYENSLALIWKLVLNHPSENSRLKPFEHALLITKVMQKNSWQECIEKLNSLNPNSISGKKQAMELMRKTIAKLINQAD